jgi:hypothetical protein
MQTLVASPFEDDASSILNWAYGRKAMIDFYTRITDREERIGQAFMNVLREVDLDEYARLAGSTVDPFYQDKNLPAAIDKLTSK